MVNGVELLRGFALAGVGTCAGICCNARERRLEFRKRAVKDVYARPSTDVYLESWAHGACFFMQLDEQETHRAIRLVKGLPWLPALFTWHRGNVCKLLVDMLGVRASILIVDVLLQDVGCDGSELRFFANNAPHRADPAT